MESIINFISNNYAWFLTITIILLFALIGYIVDTKRNNNLKDNIPKGDNSLENKEEKEEEEIPLSSEDAMDEEEANKEDN